MFIEIRHTTKRDVVFYKGDASYTSGVYTFTNAKLDSKTEVSGEYEVYAVVVDLRLDSEARLLLGSLTSKSSRDNLKTEKKPAYRPKKDIIHEFAPPENHTDDPILPLAFSIAAIVIFLIFFILICASGANLSGFSGFWSFLFLVSVGAIAVYFFLFWTTINIIQALLIALPAAPILLFIIN